MYYGDIFKFNVVTSKKANNELLKLLLPIRKKGKPVFIINYGKGEKKRNILKQESLKTNLLNELLPSFALSDFYKPINDYNTNDIHNLNEVKNYLCILNSKKFSSIDEY